MSSSSSSSSHGRCRYQSARVCCTTPLHVDECGLSTRCIGYLTATEAAAAAAAAAAAGATLPRQGVLWLRRCQRYATHKTETSAATEAAAVVRTMTMWLGARSVAAFIATGGDGPVCMWACTVCVQSVCDGGEQLNLSLRCLSEDSALRG
jgi:hypothetical protein